MTREGYRWQSRVWRPSLAQSRILDGVARGLTNAEIAAELGLTRDGVKWHVSRALAETGLSERQSLARWWQGGPLRMRLGGSNEQRAMSSEGGTGPTAILDMRPSISAGNTHQATSNMGGGGPTAILDMRPSINTSNTQQATSNMGRGGPTAILDMRPSMLLMRASFGARDQRQLSSLLLTIPDSLTQRMPLADKPSFDKLRMNAITD